MSEYTLSTATLAPKHNRNGNKPQTTRAATILRRKSKKISAKKIPVSILNHKRKHFMKQDR